MNDTWPRSSCVQLKARRGTNEHDFYFPSSCQLTFVSSATTMCLWKWTKNIFFVVSDNFLKSFVKIVEKLDSLVFIADLSWSFSNSQLILRKRHREPQGSSTTVLTVTLGEGAWDSIKPINA